MSAVPEDVVTIEQTAAPAAGETPQTVAQTASSAPETNGTAPAAGQTNNGPVCRRPSTRRA